MGNLFGATAPMVLFNLLFNREKEIDFFLSFFLFYSLTIFTCLRRIYCFSKGFYEFLILHVSNRIFTFTLPTTVDSTSLKLKVATW